MRLTWLADVLRSGGVDVVEHGDWQARGRDLLTVEGVVWHHTATGSNWTDDQVVRLLIGGRSDLPGPLSQLGLDRIGRWHVIAAGKANHNGHGKWGNQAIGVEAFNDGDGEPWPVAQVDAWVRGTAAICRHAGWPSTKVLAHKETDPTRKIDPRGIDMNIHRARIHALLTPPEDDLTPEQDALLRATAAKVEGIFGTAVNLENFMRDEVQFREEVRAKLNELDAGDVTPEEFVAALRAALA